MQEEEGTRDEMDVLSGNDSPLFPMGSPFAPDVRGGGQPIVIPERVSAFDEEERYNSIQVGVADAIEGGHTVISRQVCFGRVLKIKN